MHEILLTESRFFTGTDPDLTNVLVIENDEAFAFSLMQAFDGADRDYVVNIVSDVKGMLRFLSNRPRQDWYLVPDIIAIDLNDAGLDGFEFLARMENHPKFHDVPVIAFTKFCKDKCRLVSKAHDNSLCVRKPKDPKSYVEIISGRLPVSA